MFEKLKHYKECAEGFENLSDKEEKSFFSVMSVLVIAVFLFIKGLLQPEVISWLLAIGFSIYIYFFVL